MAENSAGYADCSQNCRLKLDVLHLVLHGAAHMLLVDYNLMVKLFAQGYDFLPHLLKFIVVFHFLCDFSRWTLISTVL